jgi:hypothetical protein
MHGSLTVPERAGSYRKPDADAIHNSAGYGTIGVLMAGVRLNRTTPFNSRPS